jgi:hypothetical protein
VLREKDLDRHPSGQAGPPGAVGGSRLAPGAQGQRQWNRPEPTVQEVPDSSDEDGAQPAPVVTPAPGSVYYRPGVQSTGRLNLQIAPNPAARR